MPNNSIERYKKIKAHFEKEAEQFDKFFFKVAPFYNEVIDALISAIPFKENKKLLVIDLGCGTGNITIALKKRYPDISVVCIDIAENMMKLAKAKLNKYPRIEYWVGDMRKFDYNGKYDAIISSLVMHHLEEDDKKKFYKRVFDSLSKGGVFYNADILLGANPYLSGLYIKKWKEFMRRYLSPVMIAQTLKKHNREDRPVKLMTEIKLLEKAGFKDIDVIWKKYFFAVYGGKK